MWLRIFKLFVIYVDCGFVCFLEKHLCVFIMAVVVVDV